MSGLGAAREFVGQTVDVRDQGLGGEVGEARSRIGGRLRVGGEPGEAERLIAVDAQDIGDGENARCLRRAGLSAPVVDRGAADVRSPGKPCLGTALPGEGLLDQFKERAGGGVVGHISMCTEMARVDVSVALPTTDKKRLELARHGKRALGVSHVYLTRAQACGRLNISPPTLAKRIRDGELVAIKTGEARSAHVKVSLASIEEYEKRRQIRREGVAA